VAYFSPVNLLNHRHTISLILKKWQIIQLQRAKPKIFWKAKVTEFANWQKISKNILEFRAKKRPLKNQGSKIFKS